MASGEATVPETSDDAAAVASRRREEQRLERAKRQREKAQLGGLWSRRDVIGRVGWMLFGVFSLTFLLAALRAAFPRILFVPPSSFKAGVPGDFAIGEEGLPGLDRARTRRVLRIVGEMHPSRLHPSLAQRRSKIQMPLSRQRLLQKRHQLRGAGTTAAGSPENRSGRGRPDQDRQKHQVPVRKGPVGKTWFVPESLISVRHDNVPRPSRLAE